MDIQYEGYWLVPWFTQHVNKLPFTNKHGNVATSPLAWFPGLPRFLFCAQKRKSGKKKTRTLGTLTYHVSGHRIDVGGEAVPDHK